MGRRLRGCAPLGEGELGPHLTQCGQGRGLHACQVSSWSVQPFGHSARTSQTGQTGQDRQRTDSLGRTVLQTVAQKRFRFTLCYETVVCLSVALVYNHGQTAGWIRMPVGTEVGLGPDDIVLDGDPALLRKGAEQPPLFGPCLLWPNGRPS